jgi:hypothetical protein
MDFALHCMALVRYRSDEETARYIERRRAEGKSFKKGHALLEAAPSNVVYRQMVSDWKALETA